MFDLVRKHTKVLMFLMFLLIIPAFVLVGVDGYNQFSNSDPKVASVAGRDITQAEWDFAHRNEVDRLRAQMPNIDASVLESAVARYATLERLVRQRVLAEAADKLRLATTDARLAQELQRNPTIAALRGPDGKLDMERYRQLAASQGFTPEGFEMRVRRDLSLRQVEAGVLATGFVPEAVADVALGAFFEKREVQLARFPASDYLSKVSPTDAEIEAYYQANPKQFQAAESVAIEYVVLDLDTIKKTMTVNEQDLKSYYDQNVERLSGKEERRASHILIAAAKDAPAAERDKAKARAQELLAEIRKNPAQFADLAKKHSQDPGSAESGGDLDFFARGAMVKPFEDAAFAMKKGEISDLVESDFGYHIIQLTDVKSPKQRSFEELRAGIEADLKAQQAQRKFSEAAESFTNTVYEQSDSLKPVADKLKLEIRTAGEVHRQPADGVQGPLAHAKFIEALFGDEAIKRKRNTEAIETGPNQLVSGRVVSYSPARTLPLAEVRASVREKLVATRAAELARKDGEARLAAWKKDPAQVTGTAIVVARDAAQDLAPKVLDAALRADPTALPVQVGVDLGADGYTVLNVKRIVSRAAPDDAAARQARTQVAQLAASAENQAYYEMLKERYKVRINVPRPTATTLQ
ncbi:MAG: SurA N-terminal domain-containing protein [Burkholderiaceae bacterium]|nr:SurA N-terminal domain-containing protein [Rhodoferax sp.]